MAGDSQQTSAPRTLGIGKIAAIVCKLAVTIGCFWYLFQKIDLTSIAGTITTVDPAWAALGAIAITLQIPLVGIRWSKITDALAHADKPVPRGAMIAITAIGIFFSQVLPYAAGDAMRVWMLARLGRSWRIGVVSVLIDRGIGVAMLVVFGFVVLLLPSALTALSSNRNAIVATFGAIIVAMVVGLILAPRIAPIMIGWRYTRWLGRLVATSHDVLIKSPSALSIVTLAVLIHALTIGSVWCTGRALDMSFPLVDAAVLFVVMLGVLLIPISFGGWGVRELAVVALLASHGVAQDRALLFSVSFGLVLVAGSLPGALVWALYAPAAQDASGVGHAA